jgi:uncharacterized membrane protein
VVLAVGSVRGWRNALAGAAGALGLLAGLVAVVGPRAALPSPALRLAVGMLTLMFGLRWLRKSILRAAGLIALHDESAAYSKARARLGGAAGRGWDATALAASFQVVLMEGVEVVFIVAAVGAGGGQTVPAAAGAGAALVAVLALGLLLHRPITAIPENTLKFAVGVLITAFGTFWAGEGLGAVWPGGDWALPVLSAAWLGVALALVRLAQGRPAGTPHKLVNRPL